MNRVVLMGRLTKEPEVRYSQVDPELAIARFFLAVDRRKTKNGDGGTDFISCVAFGKAAEFQGKYCHKGTKLAVAGRIQTGSYEGRDGKKVYTTDVVIEEQEFAESKRDSGRDSMDDANAALYGSRQQDTAETAAGAPEGFMSADEYDEDLPFT